MNSKLFLFITLFLASNTTYGDLTFPMNKEKLKDLEEQRVVEDAERSLAAAKAEREQYTQGRNVASSKTKDKWFHQVENIINE